MSAKWTDGLAASERTKRPRTCEPASGPETFAERATRMHIHERLAELGCAKYKVLIPVHDQYLDSEILRALDRIERGHPAFDTNPHAPFATRREWDEFIEAMSKLRDPTIPCQGRETLLKIGKGIEARQRPHAERMGWL